MVLAMPHWLRIEPSYSRPRVSDHNPYGEALFRTAKYRPEFPVKGFMDLDAARDGRRRPRFQWRSPWNGIVAITGSDGGFMPASLAGLQAACQSRLP
jgi:hypothetical protein